MLVMNSFLNAIDLFIYNFHFTYRLVYDVGQKCGLLPSLLVDCLVVLFYLLLDRCHPALPLFLLSFLDVFSVGDHQVTCPTTSVDALPNYPNIVRKDFDLLL